MTWDLIVELIENSDSRITRFDVNNDFDIVCKTKEDAECIADFLEVLGFDIHTSYENNYLVYVD